MKLKCLATIAGLYWKTAELSLTQEHPKVLKVEGRSPGAPKVLKVEGRSSLFKMRTECSAVVYTGFYKEGA